MYSLTLMGAVDLRGPDGRRIGSVLSQPKRLALLALLVLESPRRLQRDEILACLWPEVTDDRARKALRQSLYYLRRSLGPGVVLGKGKEGIGIAPSKVECDARELLRAVEEGRCADVLKWHGGELLPAFHLSDAPAPFERWLGEKRRRVERSTLECAWRLADEQARAGNPAGAAAAAKRAWELEPWGEAALQKLLRMLMEAGDEVGARAAYGEYARRLEAEEQRAPKAETLAILDSAGGPPEPEAEESEPSAPVAEAEPVPVPRAAATGVGVLERRRWRRDVPSWFWVGSAAALLALLLVAWAFLPAGSARMADAATLGSRDQPELYLESVRDLTSDGRESRRAEALTTELAARLAEGGGYQVALYDDARGERGMRLRPTLQESGEQLVLSVLVLDAYSSAVLDRLTVSAVPGPETTEALAARMAPRVRRFVGELHEWRGLAAQRIHPDALAGVRTAARELEAAEGLRRQGAREAAVTGYEVVDSLLEEAIELAPGWVEPRARRAELALEAVWLHLVPPHRDRARAHRTILRGLDHAEGAVARHAGARALAVRGDLLHWAAITAPDREAQQSFTEAAERDLERAVRLDEDLPGAWNVLSVLAEQRGDHALAYQRARKAYATDHARRVGNDVLVRLFTGALEVGDDENAARWCREARHQYPDHWLGPYCDLSRLAWSGPWSTEASAALLREGMAKAPDQGGRELETRLQLLHGVVLARGGRMSEARQILAGVDSADRSLEVLDLMAWVRMALGEPGHARQLLVAAADIDPRATRRLMSSRRYADLAPYAVVRADQ
jgi:DNA-binding SARP family transcriptional activator